MTETHDTSQFVPQRHRRPQLREVSRPQGTATLLEEIKPLSEDIAKEALRTTTLFHNTIKERNNFADELNRERARIEQFQISLNQRDSMIEQLTMERDSHRAACIRLQSILENLGNTIADSLGQVEAEGAQ